MIARAIAGIAIATLIAVVAFRARSLSRGGAGAAIVVGSLAVAVSWSWGALVIIYFVAAAAVSRAGASVKGRRTLPVVAKSGPRDAAQVVANGGVFALAALGMLVAPAPEWTALAVGSIAASEADTWGTEIGTWLGADPRSILTMRPVPPGTSGNVTIAGTAGTFLGASLIALSAALLGAPRPICIAAGAGGIGGALVDSLIGATLQSRRWCDACDAATERVVHDCGQPTRLAGGYRWLDNDAVNLVCGAAGGLLAVALAG